MSENFIPRIALICGHSETGTTVPLRNDGSDWWGGSSAYNLLTEDEYNLETEAGESLVQESAP